MSQSSQARRAQQQPHLALHLPQHPNPSSSPSSSSSPLSPLAKPGAVFSSTLIPRDYLHGRSDAPPAAAEACSIAPPVLTLASSSHPTATSSATGTASASNSTSSTQHHRYQYQPVGARRHPPYSPRLPYTPYSPSPAGPAATPLAPATATATAHEEGDRQTQSQSSLSTSTSTPSPSPSSSSSWSHSTSKSAAYTPTQSPAVQPARGAAASAMPTPTPSSERLRREPANNTNHTVSRSAVAAAANPAIAAAMSEGSRRTVPRTSSIDSAVSSLSSGSRSQRTPLDASTVTPADISNLIATAGSPEAVIIHLLKEKQHAANQNAQLWTLVDKQRTMLFALNKDLERAMRDKERYKKKLRDLESAKPVQKSEDGQSPATTLSKQSDDSPRVQAKATLDNLDRSSPVDPALTRDVSDSTRSTPSSIRRAEQLLLDQERPGSDLGPSPTSAKSTRQMLPPVRRPPPAPIKIDQAQRVRHDIEVTTGRESDSEYEDLDPEEVDQLERGRKKTREEDDKQRVALLAQEEEARSRSNMKQAKSVEPPASVQQGQAHGFPGMGLPTSPRAILTGQQPPFPGQQSPFPARGGNHHNTFLTPVNNEMHSTQMSVPMRSPGPYAGLPNSPRPGDRPPNSPMPRLPFNNRRASLASPPMSPRSMFPAPAPRSPLPPPPGHGQKARMNVPAIDASVRIDSPTFPQPRPINRSLVSDEFPGLLLPPHALPSVDIKVSSSRLRPSRNSYLALRPQEEEPVFTLSVISRTTGSELWRVEKATITLPQLDQQIRQITKLPFKLPDNTIFSGHSPAKIDARRAALDAYFGALLDCPLDEVALLVICQFLSADAIEPRDDKPLLVNSKMPVPLGPDGKPRMEGYLTKRGKNFGGWKSRYFVLHGPELKYFETPGGQHMGTIKIRHAQIGKQSPGSSTNKNQSPVRGEEESSDNQYRHAFLILEPKKKDSNALVRHVLCAECDAERDAWVEALLSYVEDTDDEGGVRKLAKEKEKGKERARLVKKGSKDVVQDEDTLRALSYDDVVAQEAPVRGGVAPGGNGKTLAKSNSLNETSISISTQQAQAHATFDQIVPMSPTNRNISAPTNGTIIQDAGAWGNKKSSVKQKKLSIWGFRGPASDLANVARQDSIGSSSANSDRKEPVRPVFGLPLAEAVEFCGPNVVDDDSGLPAVVYRCIEYLKAQNAEAEEGIFRLSGSNVIIKGLKERFNVEGDLDFLEGDTYYDVHAVASLFKQYLRELPVTVLTRELHLEFLHVLDLKEKDLRIAAFNILVHRLPTPNLALLKALSQFLLVIVNNSDTNKMTVRNVGIVFAPTLNIPAPVFSLFLLEYDLIFGNDPPAWLAERIEELLTSTSAVQARAQAHAHAQSQLLPPQNQGADEIRSPRHQMFTDLPTTPNPAFTSFPSNSRQDHDGGDESRRERHDTAYSQPAYTDYAHQQAQAQQGQGQGQRGDAHYASMNGMLAPNGESGQASKSKRRESSMLFMNMGMGGGRKGSLPMIRDEGGDDG